MIVHVTLFLQVSHFPTIPCSLDPQDQAIGTLIFGLVENDAERPKLLSEANLPKTPLSVYRWATRLFRCTLLWTLT
jgi:hypothetical protein